MFIHKTPIEQIAEERRKIEAVLSDIIKAKADLEYVAMMTDVEIDDEEEVEDIVEEI